MESRDIWRVTGLAGEFAQWEDDKGWDASRMHSDPSLSNRMDSGTISMTGTLAQKHIWGRGGGKR